MTTHPLSPKLRWIASAMRQAPSSWRRVAHYRERCYQWLGGGRFSENPEVDGRWPNGVQNPIRSKDGFLMSLDLSDWSDRRAYFFGEYYQHDVCDLLRGILKDGDRFIDIGANIGMVTLLAAQRVGPGGEVVAFEPNPIARCRLEEHVSLNHFTNVSVHDVALSDVNTGAQLLVQNQHSGKGTLTLSDGGELVRVQLRRGDELIMASRRPTIVKLDIEGYELRALRGLERFLIDQDAILIIEITDFMMRRIGDTARDLCAYLEAMDYQRYDFSSTSERWSRALSVRRATGTREAEQYDALFAKEGGLAADRIRAVAQRNAR